MLRRISAGILRKGGIGAIEDFGTAVAASWTSIGAEFRSQCRQTLMNVLLPAPEELCEGCSSEQIGSYCKDTASP